MVFHRLGYGLLEHQATKARRRSLRFQEKPDDAAPVFRLSRLYPEHVEAALGISLGTSYRQEEYAQSLDTAQIGLSLCGFGFDTVRYWEVPAHGALLLAEHPPILIPNDFTDMESAIFFGDLPGLFERFRHLSQHPETIPKIAAAGHRHFLAHHTGSARARQLLAHIEAHRRSNNHGDR